MNVLELLLRARTEGMDKIKGVENDIRGLKNTLQAGMTAFASLGLGDVIKDWVTEASEAARISGQLDAVLKSTGNAAGLNAEEIKGMASALQNVTTVDADTITSGQNMLLTFTKIGKDVFPQATETMLDMATSMNGGMTPSAEQLKGTAIQLGKALNDPIAGVTALRKVGVSLTEEQQKQIETMVKSGDIMGAQKVVLGELATEFGGSARAAAQTFSGQMEQMGNRINDVKESLGFALVPLIQSLSGVLGQAIGWFEGLDESTKGMIAQFISATAAVGMLVGGIAFILPLINPFTLLAVAAGALFVAFQNNFLGIRDIIMGAFNTIKGVFDQFIVDWTPMVQTALQGLQNAFNTALTWIQTTFGSTFQAVGQYLTEHGSQILSTIAIVAGWVIASQGVVMAIGAIGTALSVLAGVLSFAMTPWGALTIAIAAATFAWQTNLGGFRDIMTGVFSWIGQTLENMSLNWQSMSAQVGVVLGVLGEKFWWLAEQIAMAMYAITKDESMKEWAEKAKINSLEAAESVEKNTRRIAEIADEQTALAKKHTEDNLAAQLDKVITLTGYQQAEALVNWERMAKDAEEKYGDMTLGTSTQLDLVRSVTAQKSKEAGKQLIQNVQNATQDAGKNFMDMATKAVAQAQNMKTGVTSEAKGTATQVKNSLSGVGDDASSWGNHLTSNFAAGMSAGMNALRDKIKEMKGLISEVHQSYNPELPAQEWGQHLLENFATGMRNTQPKLFAQTEEVKKIIRDKFGDDGQIMKILKDFDKDKKTAEQFQQIWDSIVAGAEKVQGEFDKLKEDYDGLDIAAGEKLFELQKKHTETIDGITKKIDELKGKLSDLKDSYKLEVAGIDQSVGDKVISQEKVISNLQEQVTAQKESLDKAQQDAQAAMAKATADNPYVAKDTSKDQAKLKELQDQLAKEQGALATFMQNAKGYDNEIAEARRRNSMTDFERFIEDADKKKQKALQDFKEKKQQMQDEIAALQAQKLAETKIYEQKIAEYENVKIAFNEMQIRFSEGLDAMAGDAQTKVDEITAKLKEMKDSMDAIGNIGNPQGQAITMTLPKPPVGFASGGIVRKPTYANVAEGGMSEAIVPLPDGNSIPVQFQNGKGGGGSGDIKVEMNFGDVHIAKEADVDKVFDQMKVKLARLIQLQKAKSL